MIGIDFETIGLEPKRGNLRLIQTANGSGPDVWDAWEPYVDVDRLLSALAAKELVAHNASYEEAWMREYGVELPQGMHDTMIAWMVLQQADAPRSPQQMPRSLEHVAREVLGEELDKEMQTSDWSLRPLTPHQWAYAAKDAEVMVPLFTELTRRIEADGLEFVYDIERRARPFFDWMSRTGMYVDVPKLRAAMDELRAERDEKNEWLKENADIKWGSSKQLIEHFELDQIQGWPQTPGGKPSTQMKYMKRLKDPAIETYERWKQLKKLFEAYGDGWLAFVGDDSRIRANFLQFGTETGRTSCATPNLQNIPKHGPHREAMVSPPGRVLVVADYSQIELRVLAKMVEDATLLSIFNSDRDVHKEMAQAISGSTKVSKEDRRKAKAANFGLTYGCGVPVHTCARAGIHGRSERLRTRELVEEDVRRVSLDVLLSGLIGALAVFFLGWLREWWHDEQERRGLLILLLAEIEHNAEVLRTIFDRLNEGYAMEELIGHPHFTN